MSEGSRCPPPETLEQLSRGRLPAAEAASLARHLNECSACAQTVETFKSPTKSVSQDGRTEPQDIPHDAATVPAISLDFLLPPQLEGELGRLGSYRLLKVLGEGGMGVVFLAEDTMLERRVALKVMKPEDAANLKSHQRFLQEGKLAAALQHDHIVTIYQVGEDRGIPFLAMQLLQGESLDDRLKREGRIEVSEILRIGREVADGLGAAHARGLIHRDIKPANIFLVSGGVVSGDSSDSPLTTDLPFRVKILDFGLARQVGDKQTHLTRTGMIVGTPDYMAPEQARGVELDHRCDLFSLGCVLYQMATGQKPFRGDDVMATLMALTMEEPTPIRQINPHIPWELEERIKALMCKHPGDRPKDARAVVTELAYVEKVLAEGPAPAPTKAPERERNYIPASRRKFRKSEPTPLPPPPPLERTKPEVAPAVRAPNPLGKLGVSETRTTVPVRLEETPPPPRPRVLAPLPAVAPAPKPRLITPAPAMPGAKGQVCPRCGSTRFSTVGAGWCLQCGYIPGQPLSPADQAGAARGNPGLTWVLVTLGGVAAVVALSFLVNTRFIRGTLEWNHWVWYQSVSGLTIVGMAYLWSYFIVWPYYDNSRTYLPLISSPIRLVRLTVRMLPRTRKPLSFGAWGLTAALAVFVIVGDPYFWLQGNRMNLATPQHRFALKKSEAKPRDAKYSLRCVVIGYVLEGGSMAEVVLAEKDGSKLKYAGICSRTHESANNDGISNRLVRLTRRDCAISGLTVQAQWVDPKVSCQVDCERRDSNGIMIDPTIISWEK